MRCTFGYLHPRQKKTLHNHDVKCNPTKYLAYLENSDGCFEEKSPTEFRKNWRVAGEGWHAARRQNGRAKPV